MKNTQKILEVSSEGPFCISHVVSCSILWLVLVNGYDLLFSLLTTDTYIYPCLV